MRRRFLLAFVAALGVVSPSPLPGRGAAEASVSLALGVAELARAADVVGVGAPAESRAVWEDVPGGGRRIVTYSRLALGRVVAGRAGDAVWVRTLGGRVGSIGQKVEGEAEPSPGDALWFLRARADGTHDVVGMAQGRYPIVVEAGVPRLVAGHALGVVLPREDAAVRVLSGMRLEDALARVSAERTRP